VVLTADSTLARSTRRRQTSTGWNTAYTGANRYTLPLDEKPPADDALHPMPTERQVLNAARDRHQHWELTTEAMPAALLGSCVRRRPFPAARFSKRRMGWRLALPDTAWHRDCRARAERRRWPILAGAGGRRRGRWRRSVAGQFLHLRRPRGTRLCRRLRPCRRRVAVPAISPPRAGLNPACYGRIRIGGSGVIRPRAGLNRRRFGRTNSAKQWEAGTMTASLEVPPAQGQRDAGYPGLCYADPASERLDGRRFPLAGGLLDRPRCGAAARHRGSYAAHQSGWDRPRRVAARAF
jgi:hypothetical protein